MSTTAAPERKAGTKGAWKKAAVHTVTLESGFVVDIRLPDLPKMIEAGAIPQSLIDVAIDVATNRKQERPSPEIVKQQREFTDLVVLKSVVSPEITAEDLSDIPFEDKEMIVEFATRQRIFDAEGHHLAGLEASEDFRRFHRIGEFDPALAGL
jgi:hypothetical protein